MKRNIVSRFCRAMAVCGLSVAAALCIQFAAYADEVPYPVDPAPNLPQFDVRSGGVLAESYRYHRYGATSAHAAPPNIAPPGGWYGYGFPVQSYRWGWFGAERHYPRVIWHRGYYDDCCRWAYRRGY